MSAKGWLGRARGGGLVLMLAACRLAAGTPGPAGTLLPTGGRLSAPSVSAPAQGGPTMLPATQPVPAATQPVPAATQPVPAATQPMPAATQPVPAATQPMAETLVPTESSHPATAHAVILVSPGDVLNVRGGPGADQPLVGRLDAHATDVLLTGRETAVGGETWVELAGARGPQGWVNARYLTEAVSPGTFCSDARVPNLVQQLRDALDRRDGQAFSALVSPAHGLVLQYLRGGTPANYSPDEARFVFQSTYVVNWGPAPGSGLPIRGTFHGEILPKLADVLDASPATSCDHVLTGGTTYTAEWPYEYGNINFWSLYRAGPAGQELNWRTWLLGVEYLQGKPYAFALVHFMWEP